MDHQESNEEQAVKALAQAYKNTFASDEAQTVLADILEQALDGVNVCIATTREGHIDPLFVANANGRQFVAHHIKAMLAHKTD